MTYTKWRLRAGVGLAAALTVAVLPAAASASPFAGEVLNAGSATAIDGSYIVVFKDSAVSTASVGDRARGLAARHGGTVGHTFRNALRGFEARLSAAAARRLAADPSVAYVEQNQTVHLVGTQSPTPSWGLDRVDQRDLPLGDSYTYPTTGQGVNAYIIDTGIRFTHQDLAGRSVSGTDTVDNDSDASDCHGHGSAVAGTTGGTSYGIAKGVTLVAVRVMNCAGSGAWDDVIAGIDWVTGDHDPGELAVANMSLAGSFSQSVNDAVAASIADGVSYVIAASNDGADACRYSPGSTPEAITVGATDDADTRASFSNWGTCLDLFAPGVNITTAWNRSDTDTITASGTSLASPHAAGAAAMIRALNPSFTPQQVRDKMVADATPGVVNNPGTGSPNLLLYVANDQASNDFSMTVTPASGATDPGGSLTATIATTTTNGKAQNVALTASGLPDGASASFDPSTVLSGESSTMTIATKDTTLPGTYTVTITGTGEVTRTATYTLTVNGDVQDDFSIAVSPTGGTVEAGDSVTAAVSTTTTAGNPQTVALSASGLPSGATASFNPTSVTSGGSSTMTISTTDTTKPGSYTVTVTGTGSNATHTASYTLTVEEPPTSSCTGFDTTKTGSLNSGSSQYQPDGSWFYTSGYGLHEACLDGPDGVDFDLYLQKWTGYGWATVARSTSPGPDEALTYNGTSGYYRYRVHAYSGSGAYTLGYNAP